MTAKKNNGPDQKRFRQFDEDDVYSLHDDEPIIFKEESLSDEDFEEEEEGFGGFGGHENVDQQQVSGESIWKKTRNAMKRYNSQRRKDFQWGKMEDEAAQYDYSQAYQSGMHNNLSNSLNLVLYLLCNVKIICAKSNDEIVLEKHCMHR